MKRTDHRIIFTALGFLAVILNNDVTRDKRALRATAIARLIESFCITSIPDAFAGEYLAYSDTGDQTEQLLEHYITELRDGGSADLSFDRQTLLKMYEILLIRQIRHQQKEFYETGPDDLIANRVMQLAEEQLRRDKTI